MDLNRRLCVAPMMDWTDRHCRALHRVLSGRALLYTEMLTTGAVLHGDRERLMGFDAFERPVALQLALRFPAGGVPRGRVRVLEAVLAERGELDQQVDGVGGSGGRPGAKICGGCEHRFVI